MEMQQYNSFGRHGSKGMHPKKRHSLPETTISQSFHGSVENNSLIESDGPPLNKISRYNLKAQYEKLERLKQENECLEQLLKRLQQEEGLDGSIAKVAHLKQIREKLTQNEEEYRKTRQECEKCKIASEKSSSADNAEKAKGRNDLLRFLNRIQPKIAGQLIR